MSRVLLYLPVEVSPVMPPTPGGATYFLPVVYAIIPGALMSAELDRRVDDMSAKIAASRSKIVTATPPAGASLLNLKR